MKKKTKSKASSSSDATPYQRFYKYLPFLIYPLALFNLWFAIKYIRGHEERMDDVKKDALLQVSNAVHYVEVSLSNEIKRVKYSRSVFDIPVNTGFQSPVSTNLVNHVDNGVPDSPFVPPSFPSVSYLDFAFYRISGKPFIRVYGSDYSVGDDFGFGVIESLNAGCVVCDGVRYLRQRPSINHSLNSEFVKNDIP